MARPSKAFTLSELLITLAIIIILAIIVAIVINPFQLLAQGRDARRVTDLKQINGAVSLAQSFDLAIGNENTLYISLPDPSATSTAGDQCQGLGGLPALPTGWTYQCAASSTYRKTDGTGWLPVNFSQLNTGSPFSLLPVDPTNTTSSGRYYTYATQDQLWEITFLLEATKVVPQEGTDGGLDPAMYEMGNNLAISPFAHGMVGYWKLNEGSGSSTTDYSGSGNTGAMRGSVVWEPGQGPIGSAAQFFYPPAGSHSGSFDLGNPASLQITGSLTIAAWVRADPSWNVIQDQIIVSKDDHYGVGFSNTTTSYILMVTNDCHQAGSSSLLTGELFVTNAAGTGTSAVCGTTVVTTSIWYFIAGVYDANARTMVTYTNGVADTDTSSAVPNGTSSIPSSLLNTSAHANLGGAGTSSNDSFTGMLDDVRVYDRALSGSEIGNLYANP